MLTSSSARVGLRLTVHRPCSSPNAAFFTFSIATPKRSLSSTAIITPTTARLLPRSKFSSLASHPPRTTTPSSFFTPSLCRTRHASTIANPPPSTASPLTTPKPSAALLTWSDFFTLRTSRRRYSLASSLLGTLTSTVSCIYFLTTYPDTADIVLKQVPTDPFVSAGIAVFASMFLGWLLGPIFGNQIWRVVYRRQAKGFEGKERAFFERIKKHRVNPEGAGTNNPVPDFYGERIGSVSGYRRWLKDQRAFNRKRGVDLVR